ncbi:MAG: aminopeptidase P family protein [Candidatus Krumholzibacteriia bacterium]
MPTRERIAALRALMADHDIAAYYVPSTDPHMSEYLPDCWKRRAWVSGFTGSAGDLLVGREEAGLWTDGRYFLQGELELSGSGIELMRLGEPKVPSKIEWLADRLRAGEALGVDPAVIPVKDAEEFESALAEHDIAVRYIERNLVDELWQDRPQPGTAPIRIHQTKYAGETVAAKLGRLRRAMAEEGCRAHVLVNLDAIAWLFNIRSEDILYTPVVISYAVVTDTDATLYVDPRKVMRAVETYLGRHARVKAYEAIWDDLPALGEQGARVWLDPGTTNRRVLEALGSADVYRGMSPVTAFKAVKNPVQIKGITAAHARDGLAMVKFLRWLEEAVPAGGVTELSAARRLREFREEDPLFEDNSFTTISGYAGNGAIIHYSADARSDASLKPRGLYLIDSGGQYQDGTTDITRTVCLGRPTRRETECFTRVLMGLIDCTTTPFPAGTPGYRQEMFARRHLWLLGLDYNHGTGHGVGQYLGVHEGPHALKNIPTPPLVAGNLLSIEPGYYEPGKFGIRIENLAFVERDERRTNADKTWYIFSTVTLCPIDRRLIDVGLMTDDHVAWVNGYHKRVYRELGPRLDRQHRAWLKQATQPLMNIPD